MQTPLTFLAAFIVVLALIALTAWLVRRFSGNAIGNNANRGRMPRLAVIDAAAVDGRRRLVLVRRDNVEHLLMIGGPTDVVVELNIVRAMPVRDGAPQRPGELPRAPSLSDGPGWTDNETRPDDLDAIDGIGETPARRPQPSFADDVRRPMPSSERRSPDPATALAPDLPSGRADLPPRNETRIDPGMPRPPRPPRPADGPPRSPRLAETLSRMTPRSSEPTPAAPPVTPSAETEKELTDMTQRLEAALRRPAAPPPLPPATPAAIEPAATPATAAPPPASDTPRPPRMTPPAPAPEAPPSAPTTTTTRPGGFENLEDEMASLLGRPKSPT